MESVRLKIKGTEQSPVVWSVKVFPMRQRLTILKLLVYVVELNS